MSDKRQPHFLNPDKIVKNYFEKQCFCTPALGFDTPVLEVYRQTYLNYIENDSHIDKKTH